MRPDGFLFYAASRSDAQFADVKNTAVIILYYAIWKDTCY